jgi:hypothetical protein
MRKRGIEERLGKNTEALVGVLGIFSVSSIWEINIRIYF